MNFCVEPAGGGFPWPSPGASRPAMVLSDTLTKEALR